MGYEMYGVHIGEETGISKDINSTRVPLFTHRTIHISSQIIYCVHINLNQGKENTITESHDMLRPSKKT